MGRGRARGFDRRAASLRTSSRSRRRRGAVHARTRSVERLRASSPVDAGRLRRRRLDLDDGARRSSAPRSSAAARPARRGRHLRGARRARGTTRPPAPPARSAPTIASAARPVPSRRRRGRASAATARSGRVQAAAARARRRLVPLSDELRDELAAIAPARGCDRLAELSALFHSAGSLHLRGGGASRCTSTSPARPSRGERSRSSAARRRVGDPHLPAPRVRPGDALPAPRRGRRAGARRAAARRACSTARRARSSVRRGASSRAPAAAAPTSAAPSSAAARSRGPRPPHLELRTGPARAPRSSPRSPRADGVELRVVERGRPRRRLRQGQRDDRRRARRRRRQRRRARARGARRRRRPPARSANRLANADHANLVRTSRAAHAQLQAVRRSAQRPARPLPTAAGGRASSASGTRRCRCASSRARRPARHQGRGPPS